MKLHTVFQRCGSYGLAVALCCVIAACGGQAPDALLASAKEHLAKNELNAAIIQLKNVVQKQPELAEARFLLGKALLDRGEAPAAVVELRKASALNFPADSVAPVLARAMLRQGDARKVVEQFGFVVLKTPAATAELKTLLASAHGQLGDRKQADAALDAALSAVPQHRPAMMMKARTLAGHGDYRAASSWLTQILRTAPGDSAALALKGDLLLHGQRDWPGALAAYRAALAASATNYAARDAIISGMLVRKDLAAATQEIEALRKLQPNDPQTKVFDARLAFEKGDYKAAADQVQGLLKALPRSPQLLYLAGALAYRDGLLAQAEQHLGKALAETPSFVDARVLLAQTHLRSGRPAKVLDVIRPLLEVEQPSAQVLSIAGAAFMQSGDSAKAQALFARAAKLHPADLRSRTALALSRLPQAEGAAVGELESISQFDPATTADLVLINAYLARKSFDQALKAIDRLEKKRPDRPLPHFIRGSVLLKRGDVRSARLSLEKATSLDPSYFPAVDALATLDLRDQKPADAEKRFERLLKADPQHVQALTATARLRAQARKPKDEVVALLARAISAGPSDAAPRLMLVQYLLEQQDSKSALSAARDALAVLPENAEVLGALGRTQMATGDLNQAVNSFSQASRLTPQSALPLIALSDAHLAAKNHAEAAKSLKRALVVEPENLTAQIKSMQLALADRRFDEAMASARAVQRQRPKQAIGLSMEGEVEFSRKNWPAAATAYRAALQREALPELAQRLHVVLRAGGDPTRAQALADTWLKSHPRDTAFRFHLGSLALLDKENDAAERHFRQVIELQPDHAGALNNLAWVSAKLKKPGALAYAEKAHGLRPDEPAFIDTLATILADEGKLAQALEMQKRAVALRPQEYAFRLTLAKILVKNGDKPAARKELEQLAALGSKFGGHKEVRELLSQL